MNLFLIVLNDYYSTNSFFCKYQHVCLNADIGIWFQTERVLYSKFLIKLNFIINSLSMHSFVSHN